ncbi:protein Wnt-7b-like isoform X2 [Tetranychus urticae]|uniref:protein Wnt-7b-like isoform X2 n=1 Tax=Tetranychus urticae TaxID=32264 RepID=UPI000D653DDC|nr:protein Wnt-7b-like isoform X2 [Tetranychus urticae]
MIFTFNQLTLSSNTMETSDSKCIQIKSYSSTKSPFSSSTSTSNISSLPMCLSNVSFYPFTFSTFRPSSPSNSHLSCIFQCSHVNKSSSTSSKSTTKSNSFSPQNLWIATLMLTLFTLTSHLAEGLRIRRLTSIPEICANVTDLTHDQLIACREQSQAVLAVSEGTIKGIFECQEQFKNERWNCTPDAKGNIFNKTPQRGSQETAFFYAITSSGVVHSLSQTCRSGNITDCSCDRRMTSSSDGGWKWGGCSDNIDYAMNFAKKFVDSPDEEVLKRKPDDPEALMNLHNNRAGRLAVYRKMESRCRCHGISGSCELKTCWRVLPNFSQVGSYLKEKYEKSIKIKRNVKSKDKKGISKRRRGRKADQVNEDDLVYIRKSPNYCEHAPHLGILGTSGRRCNKNSEGPDSCDHLCCGRGYNTQTIVKPGLCNCRFRWCCQVICDPCQSKEELIYTCK